MLWPIVLPFQLTAVLAVLVILCMTALAPRYKWRSTSIFLKSLCVSALLFVPACTGIMTAVDRIRFGEFAYQSFDNVGDFRIERFLPPQAKDILVDKQANGHLAKYTISETDLLSFLDRMWERHGHHSVTARNEQLGEGKQVDPGEIDLHFPKWTPLREATLYHAPRAADGGGARCYFDADREIVYQRAAYW